VCMCVCVCVCVCVCANVHIVDVSSCVARLLEIYGPVGLFCGRHRALS